MSEYTDIDTKQEVLWLRSLYACLLFLFLILTCFIAHNSWRYLYKARLGKSLVVIFYILASVCTVFYSIFFCILAIDPKLDPFLYEESRFTFLNFIEISA